MKKYHLGIRTQDSTYAGEYMELNKPKKNRQEEGKETQEKLL